MSSSSADNEWKYGVFLSFRGPDTRKGFTGHLYKALCDKGIKTFIDDQDLMQGQRLTPALMNAIQESRIAIVVFSKTYASSTFCLEELAMIMEVDDMVVWPVFYQIDPSVVRHQKESFGEAMAKHEAREKDKVGKWESALRKAADIIGWNFRPEGSISEYQLIEEIVKTASNELLTKKKKRVSKDIINHNLQRDPVGSNSSGQKVMPKVPQNYRPAPSYGGFPMPIADDLNFSYGSDRSYESHLSNNGRILHIPSKDGKTYGVMSATYFNTGSW